ncbi:proliferating cell nuclear antigen, putative [Trichomonas vaginalis G3]|uniref:DNA sliding clamp PCNA n=1 Tax=Trichomonas vaginalis (strain ATCC PRA-98 / G3) TaxID=412133 RepID=A2DQV2_TRIV3|nr:DNA polymerase processivity factor protein [Trichomonas vaginalis G3]EAY17219.1 proliferating cell nuclear antigen, putative [Trichomonas vaginalis G3]KAI5486249.1 DNA polymerase processivity factor protein [Trichomonas vaginalis G3]|eukprot:XP_001329442.1 proliferating cell nuclear antigen [Trichomonas vaginalis G3]
MVECRLTNPGNLKKILDALRDLVEEANIECSETGLSLQAMDTAHVALVSMNLNANGFEKYNCAQNTSLGVNLGAIQKILKCGDNNDVLTLETNEDQSCLKFKFENSSSDRYFEFQMNLMDISSEHLSIPDAEPEATITLGCSEFQKICRDLAQFGDTVKITVEKSRVSFAVAGTNTNCCLNYSNFESAGKDGSQVTIQCEDKIELSFALRYLNLFTKAAPLSENVKLCLSNDRPFLVQFDLEDEAGDIKYYLAPKVDDNEDEE